MSDKKRIAAAGFGKTGRALLEFLLDNAACRAQYEEILLFNDDAINDREKMDFYRSRGVTFLVGRSHFETLAGVDTLVLSPGIDGRSKRFDRLREGGIEIVSEIEFACRFFKAPIIGVTGTNGKSTTVSLIHHILAKSGKKSLLLGNIGTPLIAEVGRIGKDAVVVLELSSFQLEEIVDFKPHIAVLLNITPDHLDRYADLDDYIAAKMNIFKNQDESDFTVINRDDALLARHSKSFGRAKETLFSRTSKEIERGAFLDNDRIVLRLDGQEAAISLQHYLLKGVHNLENLLAAALAAALAGIDARRIETAIADFKGLAHRMEPVGKIGAVEFINDSKATNVDAAKKSIESIDQPLVLILGGKDKGGDFSQLEEAAAARVDRLLLVGQAAKTIHAQLNALAERSLFVDDLGKAAAAGYEFLKERGGVVLLAPACASFDMFENFEQRGEVFKQEVQALKKRLESERANRG